VNDDPNDLTRGEMAQMVRELGRVFTKVAGLVFAVLIIATLNGSQMTGG